MRDQKIIEEVRPGLYSLKDCVHRYIDYLRKDGPEEAAVDYNQERAKLVRAKREKEELELQERRGDLHRSEDVKILITDMLIRFKTRLMAIPAKKSPILTKKTDQTEIFGILKSAIDEALTELADFDELFQNQENGEDGK